MYHNFNAITHPSTGNSLCCLTLAVMRHILKRIIRLSRALISVDFAIDARSFTKPYIKKFFKKYVDLFGIPCNIFFYTMIKDGTMTNVLHLSASQLIDWVWFCYICIYVCYIAAYPAVYGQFPQAIPQPISAVPPAQREGKDHQMIYYYLYTYTCYRTKTFKRLNITILFNTYVSVKLYLYVPLVRTAYTLLDLEIIISLLKSFKFFCMFKSFMQDNVLSNEWGKIHWKEPYPTLEPHLEVKLI